MCPYYTFIMERPSCWSRAAQGSGVETEVDGASSFPAPHTVLAAIAEAPSVWCPHPRWTDIASGTPETEVEGKPREKNERQD